MGVKSGIGWKSQDEDGIRREVYVRRTGRRWLFFTREKRFDNWQPLDQPPLADWLELLDAVRRRVGRRLVRPEDEERVRTLIRERYPEAGI